MNWFKKLANLENLFILGMGGLLAIAQADYYEWMSEPPIPRVYNTDISNIGTPVPLGTINLEDLGINSGGLGSKQYKYTLDVTIEAEDEYWEIERLGGNYYRVRREDYDDMEGHYEFYTEEKIGTLEDLYDYVKHNKVPKQHR